MDIKHPKFNINGLWETRQYSDIVLGIITRNIPIIVVEGGTETARDHIRNETFTGNTLLHTTNGQMNINFPIEATTLFEAANKFDEALKTALDEMQARQLRNKIITGGGGHNNRHNKPQ